MHVVIAWWDKRRTAPAEAVRPHRTRTARDRSAEQGPFDPEFPFPGLRAGQWITDPAADLCGLALVWDSAHSAELSLPTLFDSAFGCAPAHRWAFELPDAAPRHEDVTDLPAELDLLLHA
ncbi:hypothetical protein ABZ606_08920 [Streptomyces sp. NPDC012461]|jgi:hypothetical protein|uniref:Uncharacterized protein n=2 Tax=unclassified Streptomyces TaxID=2593676 RepID=A0A6G3QQI6_9ACTN|nr:MULTISPECIES: hypothetical protein [unclassified Streptomyces]MBM7089188.1 hypothetical protein [Streptomyces sp. S12]NEA85615.1 hypothetical protein [Streptomyces sp. SID14436]NEC81183.1 hypothetical protein [Streptomyces sp. SID7958]